MQWLETAGVAALTAGVVMLLVGAWIKHWFDKRLEAVRQENQRELEAYKQKSSARQQRVIEKLKASLAKKSTEHEVRYRRLHERMAAVLDELFAKVERAYYHVNNYASDIEWSTAPPKEEQYHEAQRSCAELSDFARRSWLFLPDSIDTTVQDFLVRARGINRALKRTAEMGQSNGANGGVNVDAIDTDVAGLGEFYCRLRRQLQALLGIEQEDDSAW